MRLGSPGEPHLTYCTNIHSGETWPEIERNLAEYVVRVKAKVCPDRPFGVGLRLSGRAAEELSAPGRIRELRSWLDERGLYVFTINGFPHGTFHGARVKEDVYLPDWLDDERLTYSNRLAELLSVLLPEEAGMRGTISTVPGAFKPRVHGEAEVDAIAERLRRHVSSLVRLFDLTGKRIALALEPEPFCQLETIDESVAFFEARLLRRPSIERFASESGLAGDRAEEALRDHLGLCLDACHMAVAFEDIDGALARLASSDIRIAKIQVSAGLEVRPADDARVLDELERFADAVYLHQVTEQRVLPGGARALRQWLDLPDALAAAAVVRRIEGIWRIHFHVPLFREELGRFFGTQAYVAELLSRQKAACISPHLEVETYTWDVLPEEHRRVHVVDAVARELAWVLARLDAGASPTAGAR